MAPSRKPASGPASGTSTPAVVPIPRPSKANSSAIANSSNPFTILSSVFSKYVKTTPSRTKLIDAYLAFLVYNGVVQFVYCVIAGNYPFNAFLAGFISAVGQFVLTASLRMQSNPVNKEEFKSVSPERAFADFIFGSVVLHFFCINFIN
ncbi:DAD family-domain-containing protein [Geopyxis carbonaria]|nr:DAD family-domain-containing protein [Geopyxis carbonaria]